MLLLVTEVMFIFLVYFLMLPYNLPMQCDELTGRVLSVLVLKAIRSWVCLRKGTVAVDLFAGWWSMISANWFVDEQQLVYAENLDRQSNEGLISILVVKAGISRGTAAMDLCKIVTNLCAQIWRWTVSWKSNHKMKIKRKSGLCWNPRNLRDWKWKV